MICMTALIIFHTHTGFLTCIVSLLITSAEEWIPCMWRNCIEKCKCFSLISIIQWIHSAFLRNNSFSDTVPWQPFAYYIHVCHEQFISLCSATYFVKCFWSSNFIYICFITLYSISGLMVYKNFIQLFQTAEQHYVLSQCSQEFEF